MRTSHFVTKRPERVYLNIVLEDMDVTEATALYDLLKGSDNPVAKKLTDTITRGALLCALAV